jgi:hypothetical protein
MNKKVSVDGFCLINKKSGKIYKLAVHVLDKDCPFAAYSEKFFLEIEHKNAKVVPCKIIYKK